MPEKSVSISCQWSGQRAHPRHRRNHTSRQRQWERSMFLMGGSAAVSLIAAFLHLSWQGECGQASWLGSKWDRSRVCGTASKASTWLWPSGANKKVSLTISSPRLPAGPKKRRLLMKRLAPHTSLSCFNTPFKSSKKEFLRALPTPSRPRAHRCTVGVYRKTPSC